MRLLVLTSALLMAWLPVAAQSRNMGGGNCADNAYNCADAPNPLRTPNTVWIEEMTWMDVRDAIKAGKTTVIIPTGGIEPNGPWLALGKHNYILHANCDAIARQLGDALCAPIVKFVPEGRIDPPGGHMMSPGTISMREETYRALLTDIVTSLRHSGFRNIILIGDSGGNQNGQRTVADSLTAIFKGQPVVAHIQEYYDYTAIKAYGDSIGVKETKADGLHDDAAISLNMYADDPASVRYAARVRAGLATINGYSLANKARSDRMARQIVAYRARVAAGAIRKAIAHGGTLPVSP